MEQNRLFTQDFSAPLDARWDYRQDDSEMEIKDGELGSKEVSRRSSWRRGNRNGVIILSVEEYVYNRLYANGQAGICARVSNDMKYCYQLVIAGRGELRLMKNTDEWEILWKKPFDYEKGRWYTLNLTSQGIPWKPAWMESIS